MENGGNYGEARSSQENKNLLKKIDDSLKDDQKIDNTEAKEIQNEYKKLKSNIVAITKEELASFAKGLGLEESASLGKTLNKLRKKSNEEVIAVTPEETENSEPQAVHPETTEATVVEININQDEIISYFNIKNPETLTKGLEESGLNLFKMLNGYKDYIENDLKGLNHTILDKIKKSILIKTGLINGVIEELKEDNKDSDILFKNNRWILNEQITDIFEQINTEILPSAFFLLKHSQSKDKNTFLQESIKGVYKQKRRGSHAVDKTNIINIKLSEIQEMFSVNLDDEGNFDEGFFSTQNVLGTGNKNDNNILKNIGFNDSGISEISLLSEADKKIEANAMKYFMIAIAAQIAIEVGPAIAGSVVPILGTAAGALVGATIGGTIDVVDMFSDTETLLDLVQSAGLVDPSYRMEKTWVDNVLAGIGLIPGMTPIIKGKKVSEFLSKLSKNEVSTGMKEVFGVMKEKIGLSKGKVGEKLKTGYNGLSENLSSLLKGINNLEIKDKVTNLILLPFEKLKGLEKPDLATLDNLLENIYEIKLFLKQKGKEIPQELLDNINSIKEYISNLSTKIFKIKGVDKEVISNMKKLKPGDVIVDKLGTRNIVSKIDGDIVEVRIILSDGEIVKDRIDISKLDSDKEYRWLNVMDFIKSSDEERLFNSVFAIDSFDELYGFIKHQGKIGDYKADDLIGIIEQFRLSPTENLSTITKQLGLRNKVALLNNNKIISENPTLKKLWPKGLENETMQGTVGNCYFVAALNGLKNHPKGGDILSDMITELPGGKSWEVKFKGYDEKIKVTQKDLDDMGTDKIHDFETNNRWKDKWNGEGSSNIGDNILERAYNHLVNKVEGGNDDMTQFARKYGEKKNKLIYEGGHSYDTFNLMLGEKVRAGVIYDSFTTHINFNYNDKDLLGLYSKFKKNKTDKDIYLVKDYLGKEIELNHGHAYTIYSFDKLTGIVNVVNPHNSGEIIKFRKEDLEQYFSAMYFGKFRK